MSITGEPGQGPSADIDQLVRGSAGGSGKET